MSCAPYRKRCPQCQEMRVYTDKRKIYCSVACHVARRRAVNFYRRFGAAGNAGAKRRIQQNLYDMLLAAGASPEVLRIACKARDRSYAAGHMAGKDCGFRKGFAAAAGERWDGGHYGKPRRAVTA